MAIIEIYEPFVKSEQFSKSTLSCEAKKPPTITPKKK